MIGYIRLHRWGYSQCRMNPSEVVVHEVESERVPVIFDRKLRASKLIFGKSKFIMRGFF